MVYIEPGYNFRENDSQCIPPDVLPSLMLALESPYALVREYICSPWNVLVSIKRMRVIVNYT